MNTTHQTLAGLCLAGFAVTLAWAEPLPSRGTLLLIDDERCLQGDIELIGDRYRVRRPTGETWLPAKGTLRLCPDVPTAYEFLRSRANLRDVEERVRLARWCIARQHMAAAREEVQAALRIDPSHREAQQLWASIGSIPTTPVVATPSLPNSAVVPVNYTETVEPAALPPTEINPDSIVRFTTRVQPILMNTCVGCHCPEKPSKFQLLRTSALAGPNQRTTQANLAAVIAQLNREKPALSPLLTRAVTAHGEMDRPPLPNRQSAAFQQLEQWVQHALSERSTPTPIPSISAFPGGTPPTMGGSQVLTPNGRQTVGSPSIPPTMPATTPGKPSEPPASLEPGDPAGFNAGKP